MKDTIPTGLIIQHNNGIPPIIAIIFSNLPSVQNRLIAKQVKDIIQHMQNMLFNIDVIFNAFNVFICLHLAF